MKIQVTQDDIANGVAKACSSCPVALAISRTLNKSFSDVSVGFHGCSQYTARIWMDDGPARNYHLPPSVQMKISVFDKTGVMEPFEFELEGI